MITSNFFQSDKICFPEYKGTEYTAKLSFERNFTFHPKNSALVRMNILQAITVSLITFCSGPT